MTTRTKDSSFLASSSKKFFKIGMGLSLLLVIGAFKLPLYSKTPQFNEPRITDPEDILYVTTILPIKKEIVPKDVKPPVKSPVVEPSPTVVAVSDPTPEPIIAEPVTELPPEKVQVIAPPVVAPPSPPRDFAEVMPKFNGGEAALLSYIAKHVYYRPAAIEEDIEGTVHVRFVVNKKGEIGQVEVVKGVHPWLDNAAIDVVKNMPSWEAGIQNGQKVSVRMVIPISFVIR